MPVTSDIAATYKGPRRVFRRLLQMGPREDRALAILMAGCAVMFIAQMPRLARQAHLKGEELNPLLGGTLLAWVFIAPLMLYALAFISHLLARAIGGKGSGFGARLALFWALLAASPVVLLHGLAAGFIGPGIQLDIVGLSWCGLFLWFWLAGLAEAGWGKT
jgi:hypothetical protein